MRSPQMKFPWNNRHEIDRCQFGAQRQKDRCSARAKQLRSLLARGCFSSRFNHQVDALAVRQIENGFNDIFLPGVDGAGRAQLQGYREPITQRLGHGNQFRAGQPGELDCEKSLRAGS